MYRYNATLYTIEFGGHNMATTQKFRNVSHDERASFVVDDVVSREPWRVRCLEIRGIAEAVHSPRGPWAGTDGAIIRLHPGGSSASESTSPTWTRICSRRTAET